MTMKRSFIAALLMFAAGAAIAQTPPTMNVGISWVPPSQYTDGSALNPATDLTGYNVLCATTSAPSSYPLSHMVSNTATSVSRAELVGALGLEFGTTYYCVLRAIATNTKTSNRSNEVSFVLVDERTPGAPVLSVQ
jgi:hypothetical protein